MVCRPCDRQRGTDRCDNCCPCFAVYPSICTVFLCLIVASVFAAVFGAYSFISIRTSIFVFDWPAEWWFVVNVSLLALVAVFLMAFLSLGLWCVCSTYGRGMAYKSFFVLVLVLALLCLLACMVCSVLVLYGASRKDSVFASALEEVWVDEINDSKSTVACRIQKQLACNGFEDGDCQSTSPTRQDSRCATRCRPEDEEDGAATFDVLFLPGCRGEMSSVFIQWHAIFLSGTTVATVLVILALFVTCGSVSFEKEK